jgi:hydroxymethylglutaryl-CoA lyase
MSNRVFIHDVTARDGFQIEANWIPTADKIAFINRLSKACLAKIEVTSFTSPKAIPNLADAAEVMTGIERRPDTTYVALAPNVKGVERALAADTEELNFFMSASDSHGRANIRMTAEQSLAGFAAMVEATAGTGTALAASISTAFGCPFEGVVPAERIMEFVARIEDLGITWVTLCDTTGVANPRQVAALCEAVLERHPDLDLTLHLHNTRGMGLANALAGWQVGVQHFDAALGGLGGCPYAPGASGNVCTEDLVHMFECMGIDTGVDLDTLIAISQTLPDRVGHEGPGQVAKAGKADRRYPLPAEVA